MVVEMEVEMESASAMSPEKKRSKNKAGLKGVLQQSREFLDFFWDIANPTPETRLKAVEALIQHLKDSDKEDELKYTLNRLLDGLAATREQARPGFSLALAQVLKCFEKIPLSMVLDHMGSKYDLGRVGKKLVRKAAFGNFFGVLALFQSGRLTKDPKALLHCVQLLQILSGYKVHLNNLPSKTLVDILSEIPESTFEEALFKTLRSDLTSPWTSPDQLQLLLIGIQNFPGVLQPKKLKKLFGSSAVLTEENIPKLLDLMKMAAKSVKNEKSLPGVALDLMKVSIKEGTFELFWKEIVEEGLAQEQFGPYLYMCLRLLGVSLPLLDKKQLQLVLKSKVMLHYGQHVVSAQAADRFKFLPEMKNYIQTFLKYCEDPEKQLVAILGFSSLTNQGQPVAFSSSTVMEHLKPAALQKYAEWLKNMFLNPDLDSCLEFSTKRQQEKYAEDISDSFSISRLRKGMISLLCSLIDVNHKNLDEDIVMDISRFILFHAFFKAKKSVSDIPETEALPTLPLDEKTCLHVAECFFSLLVKLNTLPPLGESSTESVPNERHVGGLTADGTLWIHCMVSYADLLLSRQKVVDVVKPLSYEAKEAWNRMLQKVNELQKKAKTSNNMELSAYQQLLLLVGVNIFKTPEESVDLLNDIHSCLEKALGKKKKKEKGSEEVEWIEVMVEIILSLLSHTSKLFRMVTRTVFRKLSPHITKNALKLILNVFDPEEEQSEESAVVVTDVKDQKSDDQEDESGSDEDGSEAGEQEDDQASDEEEELEGVDVNEDFRKQLMGVLQAGRAVEVDDSDDDLDDEAMMSLDENLSALFAEQKKRIQAKKDQKAKIQKEKIMRRDFKIKVLDLIEIFLKRMSNSPLIFDVIEPLISVMEHSMTSETSQQEKELLTRTASIFMHHIGRKNRFRIVVVELKDDLHDMMERLLNRAAKQSDSSVALYCFSGSLFLLKALKDNISEQAAISDQAEEEDEESSAQSSSENQSMGCLDVERVIKLYQDSLNKLLTKRNSPLTVFMFYNLLNCFPFMCKHFKEIIMNSITIGVRTHQQTKACTLLLHILKRPVVQKTPVLSDDERQDLLDETLSRVTEILQAVEELKVKVDYEKLCICFEILSYLIKNAAVTKISVNQEKLTSVLQDLSQKAGFGNKRRVQDLYWNVMGSLGIARPKKEKSKPLPKTADEGTNLSKKKKGFLPETKKRKNRKKSNPVEQQKLSGGEESSQQQNPATTSKKKKKKKKAAAEQNCETKGAQKQERKMDQANLGKVGQQESAIAKGKKKVAAVQQNGEKSKPVGQQKPSGHSDLMESTPQHNPNATSKKKKRKGAAQNCETESGQQEKAKEKTSNKGNNAEQKPKTEETNKKKKRKAEQQAIRTEDDSGHVSASKKEKSFHLNTPKKKTKTKIQL